LRATQNTLTKTKRKVFLATKRVDLHHDGDKYVLPKKGFVESRREAGVPKKMKRLPTAEKKPSKESVRNRSGKRDTDRNMKMAEARIFAKTQKKWAEKLKAKADARDTWRQNKQESTACRNIVNAKAAEYNEVLKREKSYIDQLYREPSDLNEDEFVLL